MNAGIIFTVSSIYMTEIAYELCTAEIWFKCSMSQ